MLSPKLATTGGSAGLLVSGLRKERWSDTGAVVGEFLRDTVGGITCVPNTSPCVRDKSESDLG